MVVQAGASAVTNGRLRESSVPTRPKGKKRANGAKSIGGARWFRAVVYRTIYLQRDERVTVRMYSDFSVVLFGGPVAYGQKTAVRLLLVYWRSGRSPLRDRTVSTSQWYLP